MMVYITANGEGLNPLLEISGWLNIPVTLQSASAKRQVTAYINIFISTLLLIHSTLWVSGVVQISNDTVSAVRIINLFDAASTCSRLHLCSAQQTPLHLIRTEQGGVLRRTIKPRSSDPRCRGIQSGLSKAVCVEEQSGAQRRSETHTVLLSPYPAL